MKLRKKIAATALVGVLAVSGISASAYLRSWISDQTIYAIAYSADEANSHGVTIKTDYGTKKSRRVGPGSTASVGNNKSAGSKATCYAWY